MAAALDDILSCKQPMPPAKAANVVEQTKVQSCCLHVITAVLANTELLCPRPDVGEKLSVRLWSVASKIFENLCERILRHWDLQEAVQQRDDAVVGSRFAAEVQRFVVILALVDNPVGKHTLIGDTKDDFEVSACQLKLLAKP